jgi:penicillin-binding protein 2
MYEKRVKVLIGVSLAVLLLCVLRLVQMQLLTSPELQEEIAQATELHGRSRQFKTLRGKILDRHSEILAADMPQFQVCINYSLSCFLDERVVLAKYASTKLLGTRPSEYRVHREVDDKQRDLARIIEKCSHFGVTAPQAEAKIKEANDQVWNVRSFLCWRRENPYSPLIAKYGSDVKRVPLSKAMAELERQFPDPADRYKRIVKVQDVEDTGRCLPLVELQTEEDVFTAQMEFLEFTETDEVQILPAEHRYYPYRSAAAQTIGWVGGATQPRDVNAFADDPLASYRKGEVCGREDGVEYVCESILRGRRGEVVYDFDRQIVSETETEFGQDVQLTLDINLQKQMEQRLTDPTVNRVYGKAPMAAAILDVRSGDILALVSLPSYDLNAVRHDYGKLQTDPNRPMTNRTINHHYPPGSVAKPVVLIAGLETGTITPEKVIECPAAAPPTGWPKCWIYKEYKSGHSLKWINNARNAMKGSCNIYFSHLANDIDAQVLQEWFFKFGYGREIPLFCPEPPALGSIPRHFSQVPGEIGSTLAPPYADANSVEQLPRLWDRDRKMFGIGQGNFRVTPLQVANAFATLARGGRALRPRLFLKPQAAPVAEPVDLQISAATMNVIYEGMHAVVSERDGTAYEAFANSGLAQYGVTVYGKTGSTEGPFDAWFAGFAKDEEGAKIALALVVEGGQSGGRDAGPLAPPIIQLCIQAGYVGHKTPTAAK